MLTEVCIANQHYSVITAGDRRCVIHTIRCDERDNESKQVGKYIYRLL